MIKWIIIAVVSIAAITVGMGIYYYYGASVNSDGISGEQKANENTGVALAISESMSTNSSIVTPNPYVREFQLPKDNFPNGILVDRSGIVWTVGAKSNSLIAIDPEKQKAQSYQASNNKD